MVIFEPRSKWRIQQCNKNLHFCTLHPVLFGWTHHSSWYETVHLNTAL